MSFTVKSKIFRKDKYICLYPIVALDNSFFIFGGDTGTTRGPQATPTKTIAVFSTITKQWKNIGELNVARYGHGVFVHKGEFFIIGGPLEFYQAEYPTELCTLESDSIQCTVIDPMLKNYYSYPEMMRVPADYCQK